VQDRVDRQEGIGQAARLQGHGDGGRGIAHTEPFTLHVGMDDLRIRISRMRVQGFYLEDVAVGPPGELGQGERNAEGAEIDAFQFDVFRLHRDDAGFEIQVQRIELLL
jgi:hypothetical protein